jgi:hypothetical protein
MKGVRLGKYDAQASYVEAMGVQYVGPPLASALQKKTFESGEGWCRATRVARNAEEDGEGRFVEHSDMLEAGLEKGVGDTDGK